MEWTNIIEFMEETERLKSVLRTSWTSTGRNESTAEHSWRLALFALVSMADFPELDREKVLMLCLVHDLGELYSGDISAALKPNAQLKLAEETKALEKMCSFLPDTSANLITALWMEYEHGETPESQFVRALDKAETILQHTQGKTPDDFDYAFNLSYGKSLFGSPKMQELRALLDAKTQKLIMERDGHDGKNKLI